MWYEFDTAKWSPNWIYYNLLAYNISHKQAHFAYIRTYQVFASLAHTAGTVNTCSSIAEVGNCNFQNTNFIIFLCFFLTLFLSKTLFQGIRCNSIVRKSVRVSLQQNAVPSAPSYQDS